MQPSPEQMADIQARRTARLTRLGSQISLPILLAEIKELEADIDTLLAALAAERAAALEEATRLVCEWCAAGSKPKTLYYGGEAVGRGPCWHGGMGPPDPTVAIVCPAANIHAALLAAGPGVEG